MSVRIFVIRVHLYFLLTAITCQSYAQAKSQWKLYHDSLNYFLEQKNAGKCIVYYDKLIALDPKSTNNILIKGAFLYDIKDCKASINEFSKVLVMNDKIIDARVRRGKSYLCLHKYDSSIIDFTSALGVYKHQDSVIYLFRSYTYDLVGNKINAKLDFDSALNYHKSIKELHHSFGLVKYEMQDLTGAITEFNKSIQIDKGYLPAIKGRIISNFDLGLSQDCFQDCLLYLEKFPNDIEVNYIIAVNFFERKDYKSTLKHIKKCKTSLKTKGMYYLSGMTNFYLANDSEAISDMTVALKLNPIVTEESLFYYIIGLCKNNIKPKSGCKEILTAIKKGSEDAKRNYSLDCQ